jgi:hypothetical protein
MIATGLLLATSEAEKYAPNPFFWTKMLILRVEENAISCRLSLALSAVSSFVRV